MSPGLAKFCHESFWIDDESLMSSFAHETCSIADTYLIKYSSSFKLEHLCCCCHFCSHLAGLKVADVHLCTYGLVAELLCELV